MKEALWGVLIVELGLFGIVVINIFQNVTIGNYTITVEDINEIPSKISLRIRSGITSLRGEEFGK